MCSRRRGESGSGATNGDNAQLRVIRTFTLAVLVTKFLYERDVECTAVCVELRLDVLVLHPRSNNNAEVIGDTLPDEVYEPNSATGEDDTRRDTYIQPRYAMPTRGRARR